MGKCRGSLCFSLCSKSIMFPMWNRSVHYSDFSPCSLSFVLVSGHSPRRAGFKCWQSRQDANNLPSLCQQRCWLITGAVPAFPPTNSFCIQSSLFYLQQKSCQHQSLPHFHSSSSTSSSCCWLPLAPSSPSLFQHIKEKDVIANV